MTKRYFAIGALLFARLAIGCGGDAEGGDQDDAGMEPPDEDAGDAGSEDGSDGHEHDAAVADGGANPGADATNPGGDAANPVGDATLDDVDLTLGGFNQDLPAPAGDCVNRTTGLVLGCMAVSGTYNGAAFQLACEENKLTVGKGATHIIGCRGPVGSGDMVVELRLDAKLIAMRGAVFSANEPAAGTYVSVWHLTRQFASYPKDVFALAQTHEQSIRISGISERVMRGTMLSPREDWRVRGAFGLALTPKSSCAPDGMGGGCDAVKLRAQFNAFPIE